MQTNEGVEIPSWTGLGVDPAVQPLKGQFPRGTGRSQVPRRQQVVSELWLGSVNTSLCLNCTHVPEGGHTLAATRARTSRKGLRASASHSVRAGRTVDSPPCAHVAHGDSHSVQQACDTRAAMPGRQCGG
ncbi:GTP-binding protein-like (ISS) [Dorcoceras hygrometricum]|uniref:GTP-binding protein-like (ISS) n=1 Tax=Dorcoceras hygrometricum TaxID=472368 RepID=A0A2Z7A283_9LAMI|nr:GTP-binding protein-like (ISS) [Dorcoceras hygrometricum]